MCSCDGLAPVSKHSSSRVGRTVSAQAFTSQQGGWEAELSSKTPLGTLAQGNISLRAANDTKNLASEISPTVFSFKGAVDLERALDTLSACFNEGNNQLTKGTAFTNK